MPPLRGRRGAPAIRGRRRRRGGAARAGGPQRMSGGIGQSAEPLPRRLLDGIEPELPAAVALRRRLHERPELAHAEERTAEALARELPVACARVAGTGLIARVGPADGRAVAVRAELDGLPIEERTGAPFSATGATMHACGHDVHMANLIGTARWLTDHRALWAGTVVLIGQPELRDMLESPRLRQLRQRITVRYHLRPLSRLETEYYIQHRLHVAGGNGRPGFSRWAIRAVHRYSGGVPRLINAVCDKALLCGYVAGTDRLEARHVRRAIRELEGRIG